MAPMLKEVGIVELAAVARMEAELTTMYCLAETEYNLTLVTFVMSTDEVGAGTEVWATMA